MHEKAGAQPVEKEKGELQEAKDNPVHEPDLGVRIIHCPATPSVL